MDTPILQTISPGMMIPRSNIERVVSLPVINPATGWPSRTFEWRGKIDIVDGGRVIDWKSCRDPQRTIKTKALSYQVELYALACEHEGIPINEVVYRLITVPSIKFCGKDADASAYEDRCYEWLLEPGRMVEHPFMVNRAALDAARRWLWDTTRRQRQNQLSGVWLPNEHACFQWERECEYFPMCEAWKNGTDPNLRDNYDKVDNRHPELGDDARFAKRQVVTYSSLSLLTTCERKHYYKYELGLRKKREDSESLWVGSAMHVGLEKFAADGVDAARKAIAEWADANPVLGEDAARNQEQQVSRAMAMCRAAETKWGEEHAQ